MYLFIRLSGPQPLLTFHFLTTEGHARTVTVPLDGGQPEVATVRRGSTLSLHDTNFVRFESLNIE